MAELINSGQVTYAAARKAAPSQRLPTADFFNNEIFHCLRKVSQIRFSIFLNWKELQGDVAGPSEEELKALTRYTTGVEEEGLHKCKWKD